MNSKSQIITAVGLSLFVSLGVYAQPGLAARRPSLDETRPVLREAAQKALQTLYGSMYSDISLTEFEILDMASPGWKRSSTSTNEVIYWPVRVRCAFSFKDDGGKSGSQKLGILYRVWRGEGDKCQAEFSDLFVADTLEERAAKLKQSRDTARVTKAEARRNVCINNLRQLDGAKQMWGLEHRKPASAIPTATELKEYLPGKQMVVCPEGGTYAIGPLNALPTCTVKDHIIE